MSGKPKQTPTKPRKAKKRYWDTCVFLAWIKDEQKWPEDVMKGIAQTVEMAMSGEVVIVTSSLTLTEVFSARMTKDQKAKFSGIFSAPYMQLLDVDRKVSASAGVIREFYDTRKFSPDGRKKVDGSIMAMADAIHLATAIHYKVDEFLTLDGCGEKPKPTDLLRLNGSVAGARLSIRTPYFTPPPKFSDEPNLPVVGPQPSLFDELDQNEPERQKNQPEAVDIRGGGNEHSQDTASTEGAKTETESVPPKNEDAEQGKIIERDSVEQQELDSVVGQAAKLRPAATFLDQEGIQITPQQDYDWHVASNSSDGIRIVLKSGHGITVPHARIGGFSQGCLLLTGQYTFKGTEASFVPFDPVSPKTPIAPKDESPT